MNSLITSKPPFVIEDGRECETTFGVIQDIQAVCQSASTPAHRGVFKWTGFGRLFLAASGSLNVHVSANPIVRRGFVALTRDIFSEKDIARSKGHTGSIAELDSDCP
jgi:hypothetical protein